MTVVSIGETGALGGGGGYSYTRILSGLIYFQMNLKNN